MNKTLNLLLLLGCWIQPGCAGAEQPDRQIWGWSRQCSRCLGVITGLPDEQLPERCNGRPFVFLARRSSRQRHGAGAQRHCADRILLGTISTKLGMNPTRLDPFGPDACAVGGTGFGIMSTVAAVERKWIGSDTAVRRRSRSPFPDECRLFPRYLPAFRANGRTGKPIRFDRLDDAADI